MTGEQTLVLFLVSASLFATYKISSKAFDYFGKKNKRNLELQKNKIEAEIKKEKTKTKQEELKKDVAVIDALSKTLESNDRTLEPQDEREMFQKQNLRVSSDRKGASVHRA